MTRSKLNFLAEFQKSLPYFLSYQAGEHFLLMWITSVSMVTHQSIQLCISYNGKLAISKVCGQMRKND